MRNRVLKDLVWTESTNIDLQSPATTINSVKWMDRFIEETVTLNTDEKMLLKLSHKVRTSYFFIKNRNNGLFLIQQDRDRVPFRYIRLI